MSIQTIPSEMRQEILQRLDGVSTVAYSRVSSLFNKDSQTPGPAKQIEDARRNWENQKAYRAARTKANEQMKNGDVVGTVATMTEISTNPAFRSIWDKHNGLSLVDIAIVQARIGNKMEAHTIACQIMLPAIKAIGFVKIAKVLDENGDKSGAHLMLEQAALTAIHEIKDKETQTSVSAEIDKIAKDVFR